MLWRLQSRQTQTIRWHGVPTSIEASCSEMNQFCVTMKYFPFNIQTIKFIWTDWQNFALLECGYSGEIVTVHVRDMLHVLPLLGQPPLSMRQCPSTHRMCFYRLLSIWSDISVIVLRSHDHLSTHEVSFPPTGSWTIFKSECFYHSQSIFLKSNWKTCLKINLFLSFLIFCFVGIVSF